MTNFKDKLKRLDSEISKIDSAIKELDKTDLKTREDNLKKLFDVHYKMATDMYELGYFIYDYRINKFYVTPDVFNISQVSNFVGTLVNNDSDKDVVTSIGHKLTDNVSFDDFKKEFLKGGGYTLEGTIGAYKWNTDSFIERFKANYSEQKQTCGLLEALEQDIILDIKKSCISIEIQFGYSQYEENSDDENSEPITVDKIYVKYIELSRESNKLVYLRANNYKDNKIPYGDMQKKLSDISDIYNESVIHICSDESDLMTALNSFSLVRDASATTDLQIKLDTLKTQRRVVYRQHIYNDINEIELKPLNILETNYIYNKETGDDDEYSLYDRNHMRRLHKFWTTPNVEVTNVQKVVVLKRNESKVKLRIFIDRKFWTDSEGNLALSSYGNKDLKQVFLSMYIDKLIDPRLYIDFVIGYRDAMFSYGHLDTTDTDHLDNIKYDASKLYLNQTRSVSNWKWLFPEEVYSSYNVSELNLIEW